MSKKGALRISFKISSGSFTKSCLKMSTVAKSYEKKDPIIDYCSKVRLNAPKHQ
jgi:hypothetical protein